jgi:glycosyltransferase involved in cell wall biosynthesis
LRDVLAGLRQNDLALRRRLRCILTGRNAVETLDSIPENFVVVTPPLTLPINWLPPGRVYDFFQRFNNGIVLRAIRRALKTEQMEEFVFINCYDPFYAGWLPLDLGAKTCIYHCIDDITQNAYTARHGERLENEACRHADFTFVTSTNLARLKAPHARRIVKYVNAADFSVFQQVLTQQYPRPELLAGRSGPVIGFIGNLDELRIDYALLKKIALHFPDTTLLLVGPLNSKAPAAIGLDRLPNVIFAGARRLHDLPPLLQHMDCVLIPFLCNTLTFSIYPLKINEYLAAGKPVVSTCFSEDIRTFADHCFLAETPEDFLTQIERALLENDPALVRRRTALAQTNTWEARIRQLRDLLAVNYD